VYQHVLNQFREIAGHKAPYLLAAGTVLLVVALILLLLPPWRRFVKQCLERGGWRGILVGTISVVLALVVGATVIEALRGSLLDQSREFDRTHGRKSETNLSAVRTIWGSPEELRELQVGHFVTEEKIVFEYKDGRKVPQEELQALSPSDLGDEGDSDAPDADSTGDMGNSGMSDGPGLALPAAIMPPPPGLKPSPSFITPGTIKIKKVLPTSPSTAAPAPNPSDFGSPPTKSATPTTAPSAPSTAPTSTAPAESAAPAAPSASPATPATSAPGANTAGGDTHRNLLVMEIDKAPVGVLFQAPRSSGDDKTVDKPLKRKIKVRREIPQNSIVRGKVDVDLHLNYRPMGSAFYTCYTTNWKLDYTVKNRSNKTTEADFRFPQDRTYNNLAILVDGKRLKTEDLMYKNGAQTWSMPMAPGQEVSVAISFDAKGMDSIRYIPASMAMREDYKVTMKIFPCVATKDEAARGEQQLTRKKISPAMGAMPADRVEDASAAGQPMTLGWDLKSAATNQDVGVRLPEERSEGYLYCGRLLHEAPEGVLLLVGALIVSWMLLGRQPDLFSLAFLAVSYGLYYTLLGYLSDVIPSFAASFAIAAAATLFLAGLYLWFGWGCNFAAHQTFALVAVFTVYYPLAVTSLGITSEDYSGLMLQILYWGLAAYAALLAVGRVRRLRREAAAA
jgi:hypothetical protein